MPSSILREEEALLKKLHSEYSALTVEHLESPLRLREVERRLGIVQDVRSLYLELREDQHRLTSAR